MTWFCAGLCRNGDTMNYVCCNILCMTCSLLQPFSANISKSTNIIICCFQVTFPSIVHILNTHLVLIYQQQGAGIAQWSERWTCDWKVVGSNPCWSGRIKKFSRVDFLYWLLFWYPFHPPVTTVAHKKSWSFCQKCRWQVTAKHAYILHMWLCMKWHGAWLYGVHRTCAEIAAVSCGISHASVVSTPLPWIFKKRAIKS